MYDFGGGTFDAAVVQVRDGEFAVVDHAGTTSWAASSSTGRWWRTCSCPPYAPGPDGRAGPPRPRHARNLATLKLAAENAKIELSHAEVTEVAFELTDARDRRTAFLVEMAREDVARAALPFYRRSVTLCHRALRDGGLARPTSTACCWSAARPRPGLRGFLADPREGLGIPLDHGLDPVTVVARGAAIFARTQRLPREFAGRRPRRATSGWTSSTGRRAATPTRWWAAEPHSGRREHGGEGGVGAVGDGDVGAVGDGGAGTFGDGGAG
ncbi:Hsp70 family protein [Streptomyces sp. M19]